MRRETIQTNPTATPARFASRYVVVGFILIKTGEMIVVEDEVIIAEDLMFRLNKLGYRILPLATTGKEAIEICKQNQNIDLILMDIKMPVMNGYEATKLIKEFRPDLPIVAQTAYTTTKDKEKAFSAGCNDFISKPISKETLNEIMNKYLKNN